MNPFYWYSAIWSCVLFCGSLQYSTAYGATAVGISAFFLVTIALSLVAGFYFSKFLKRINIQYRRPKHVWLFTVLIACGYSVDFLYAGHVPLVDELTGAQETYQDFTHCPIIHVLTLTFALFYAVYMFYHFLNEKKVRLRLTYLAVLGLIALLFLCLYNRGALMMIAFMCAVLFLSKQKKIRWWHITLIAALAILILYLFGVLGNLRSDSKWYDTSYIIEVAQIDESLWPKFVPKPFIWAYVYLVTPLGNLSNYARHFSVMYNPIGVLYCIIPDVLSNMFLYWLDKSFPLVIDSLTVSSAFASSYQFGGYIGMTILFICMILLVCVLMRLALIHDDGFMTVATLCSCVVAFSFFDNYVTFTGVTFAFIYPLIPAAIELWKRYRRGELKKPIFYPIEPCVQIPVGFTGASAQE
jgi:oligosaccharide repeat unit polymerase